MTKENANIFFKLNKFLLVIFFQSSFLMLHFLKVHHSLDGLTLKILVQQAMVKH